MAETYGTIAIVLAGIWIFISPGVRTFRGREGGPEDEEALGAVPAVAFSLATNVLAAYALWGASRMFFPVYWHGAVAFLAAAIVASPVSEYVTWFVMDRMNPTWEYSKPRASPWAACAALGGAALATGFVGYLRSSPPGDYVVLEAPVSGQWRVYTGGRSELTNHHHERPHEQNWAVDLVKTGAESASLGQEVLAPVSGTMKKVVADYMQVVEEDRAAGNFVTIETPEGIEIVLAHLMEDSVTVIEGDAVKAGEKIGACGQTGSAARPHLHIHAEKNGEPVPIRFAPKCDFPIRGDTLHGK